MLKLGFFTTCVLLSIGLFVDYFSPYFFSPLAVALFLKIGKAAMIELLISISKSIEKNGK